MRLNIKSILAKVKHWLKANPVLVLFFLLFAFLRLYNLAGHATFLGDQGRDAIIIKRILTFEHFPAIGAPTSIGMVYLGPFYYYFMAPWLALSNFNPIGLALGVALLSIFFGGLAFFIIRKHFDNLTAFLFLCLLTFSATNIELSRFSWNPNLLPIFTFFTLYFFYLTLKEKGLFSSLLFGAFFSFSLQLHYLAALVLPALFWFFMKEWWQHRQFKRLLIKAFVAIFSFALFSTPLVIFDLRHNFLNSRNFMNLFFHGNVAGSSSYFVRLGETVVGLFAHTFQIQLPVFWAISLWLALLLVLIVYTKKAKNLFAQICLGSWLSFILGFALLNSARYAHYYAPLYYAFFLNLALLFAIRMKVCNICRVIISIFLVAYITLNLLKFKVIFTQGGHQIAHSQKVAAFLERKINNLPFNIATWPVQFTEDNYLYFLETSGHVAANRQNVEISKQMYVLCNVKECPVLNSPSWNISMFGPARIAKIWTVENIKIYKLVHRQ